MDEVTITLDKNLALYVYRLLEASAVCRPVFLQLAKEMRGRGWL
jgi:hypothetical protein